MARGICGVARLGFCGVARLGFCGVARHCVIAWPGWPAGFLRQFAVARLAGWVLRWPAGFCGGRLGFAVARRVLGKLSLCV